LGRRFRLGRILRYDLSPTAAQNNFPRSNSDGIEWIKGCLSVWSSDQSLSRHGHGIPQGPLASDFLAECFLLPVDLKMKPRVGYTRYVDDVRLLGKSENQVHADLIELERHYRERGLIPQTGKFAIKQALDVDEALGMLPSVADPQHEEDSDSLNGDEARKLFRSALGGRPLRVTDKTRLRYVLYRGPINSEILRRTLALIPHHPEHADAFFHYLGKFGYRKPIERLCLTLIRSNAYPYIRGEAWHVLARYRLYANSTTSKTAASLRQSARAIARSSSEDTLVERWGACHFLCSEESVTRRPESRIVKHQAPLLQAILAPALPDTAFTSGGAVESYLLRNHLKRQGGHSVTGL
jgi:hypothetical protein